MGLFEVELMGHRLIRLCCVFETGGLLTGKELDMLKLDVALWPVHLNPAQNQVSAIGRRLASSLSSRTALTPHGQNIITPSSRMPH